MYNFLTGLDTRLVKAQSHSLGPSPADLNCMRLLPPPLLCSEECLTPAGFAEARRGRRGSEADDDELSFSFAGSTCVDCSQIGAFGFT